MFCPHLITLWVNLVFFVARHDDGDELRPKIAVTRQLARIRMIALKFARHHAFLVMKQSLNELANSILKINLLPADELDIKRTRE